MEILREPMTNERMTVIRAMLSLTDLGETQHQVISELMAEVERLRVIVDASGSNAVSWLVAVAKAETENAAMRKIVAAVAEAGVGDEYGGGSWLMFAGYRAETIHHQAQAFVAAHPAPAESRSGDEQTYISDWCADAGLSHDLCTDGACECKCHGEPVDFDEHGYWTRRPDGGLHYHAYDPATEDDESEAH